jgi:hypothetical protein
VQTTSNEIIEVKFEIDNMEKVVGRTSREQSRGLGGQMPLTFGHRIWRAKEVQEILDRARDFQPVARQGFRKFDLLRGRGRESVFRSVHAHALTSNRREMPRRRRGFDHRAGLQRLRGRIAGRHIKHARRHAP